MWTPELCSRECSESQAMVPAGLASSAVECVTEQQSSSDAGRRDALLAGCRADSFAPSASRSTFGLSSHFNWRFRERMSWWSRLKGGTSDRDSSRPVDFLREALELESRGDYANALTSYRLAL